MREGPLLRLASFREQCRALSRKEFVRKHSAPWLIREIGDHEERAFTFKTAVNESAPMEPPSSRDPAPSSAPPWIAQAERFLLIPVVKSPENRWEGRILVGRAGNNDIILRDSSVSKLHAHFTKDADGAFRLYARKTVNGTFVDGQRLTVDGNGVRLPARARIRFGALSCAFIMPAELHQLLFP